MGRNTMQTYNCVPASYRNCAVSFKVTDLGSGGCQRGGRNMLILPIYTDTHTYTLVCVCLCYGWVGGLIDGWRPDRLD